MTFVYANIFAKWIVISILVLYMLQGLKRSQSQLASNMMKLLPLLVLFCAVVSTVSKIGKMPHYILNICLSPLLKKNINDIALNLGHI